MDGRQSKLGGRMNRNNGECVGFSPYSRIYCFSPF
jgi:hypothetical protein